MAGETREPGVGGDVCARLRADILSGRFKPGERLKFSDLTQRFGAGVGTIREALVRLSEQGLVRCEHQRGFRIMALTRQDLENLTRVRVELELLALREALAAGASDWERGMLEALHTLEETPMYDGDERLSGDWAVRHERLHEAILAGCGNARLLQIAADMRAGVELYWRAAEPLWRGSDEELAEEHRRIVTAALARDVDAAVAAMTANITRTADLLRDAPHLYEDDDAALAVAGASPTNERQ